MQSKASFPVRRAVSSAFFSFSGIVFGSLLFNNAYHLLWVLLFSLSCWGGFRFLSRPFDKTQAGAWLFSFLFLFAQLCGYQLNQFGESTISRLLLCAGTAAAFSPALGSCLAPLISASASHQQKCSPSFKQFVLYLSLLLLAWTPVFLAYYPGLFAYDSHSQIYQYLQHSFNAAHPLLHTLWLSFFYSLGDNIGSYTLAFGFHIISQMILMAAVFSATVCYVKARGCARWMAVLLMLFYAFFPVHSILSVSCTKDVLFSGSLTLFCLGLHRLWTDPALLRKPLEWAGLAAICLLMCLLRNNACYALALLIPFSFFLAKSTFRLRSLLLILLCFAVSFGSYRLIQTVWGSGAVESRESLSVPCQQLARTAVLHAESDNPLIEEIQSYFPNVHQYMSYRADNIKNQLWRETPADPAAFLQLWLRGAIAYPLEYLDAFLSNTQGLWWLDDVTHAESYGKGLEGRQGYLLTDTKEGFKIEHTSLLPALETLYERLFSANEYQLVPLLSKLFAPSFYFWLMLFLLCRMIVKKQTALLIPCLLLLFYAGTVLLGPCILIRYCYPLVIMMPLLAILSFRTSDSL